MLRAEAAVFTPKESLTESGEFGEACSTVAPSPALTSQAQESSEELSPYWGFEESAFSEDAMWAAAALYAGYVTDEGSNYPAEFALPDSGCYPEFTTDLAYVNGASTFTLDGGEDLQSSLMGYLNEINKTVATSDLNKISSTEVCLCGQVLAPEALFCQKCGTKRPVEDGESQVSTSAGGASPPFGLVLPPGLEVPPGLDLEEIGPPPGLGSEERKVSPLPLGSTTAMLRNIPNKYTQKGLVDRLHELGYRGQLDFMYLPIDFKNKCNVGYAFVNFRTPEACEHFAIAFHQSKTIHMLPGYNSKKVCEVAPARYQGCEENVRRLQASSVMSELLANPEWLPKLFDENGQEVGFPFADSSTKEASQPSRSARGRLPRRKGSM